MDSFEIRESALSDFAEIERLYPDAFPNEELRPLVRALLQETPSVLSLVAIAGWSALIGHIVFTPCSVAGGSDGVALLGPLAVAPAWQKRGVGSALVRAGLDWLRSANFYKVFVLGDPAYYGRFGFETERSVVTTLSLIRGMACSLAVYLASKHRIETSRDAQRSAGMERADPLGP